MTGIRVLGLAALGLVVLFLPAFGQSDMGQGKATFGKCAVCHQVGPDAKNLVGPELTGIIGRKAASAPDYVYSPGMKRLGAEGFIWTEEALDRWIANPKDLLPDSPMALAFEPIADAQERADIIAFLKTFQ